MRNEGDEQMSQMTSPAKPVARPGEGPRDSWSRSVSPAGRASRRRWVMAVAFLVIGGGVVGAFGLGGGDYGLGALALLSPYIVLAGGLQTASRNITIPWRRDLDDRDRQARGSAYVIALPIFAVAMAVSLAVLYFALPEVRRVGELAPGIPERQSGGFLALEDVYYFAVWCFLWVALLPPAIVAWTEPDPVEPEPGEGLVRRALTEPARDALLGVAVALAVGLGLAGLGRDSGVELVWFGLPFAAGALLWYLDNQRLQRERHT